MHIPSWACTSYPRLLTAGVLVLSLSLLLIHFFVWFISGCVEHAIGMRVAMLKFDVQFSDLAARNAARCTVEGRQI